MDVVSELERRLRPALRAVRDELALELPGARVEVVGGGGGAGSWYALAVACYPSADDLLRGVALQIDACGLDSAPTLQALVWWDAGPCYECELFPRPVPASREALRTIADSLPALAAALKEAARRGRPETRDRILFNGAN